jgi:hypothetical protein
MKHEPIETEAASRRHLERRLLEQLERTFTTEGSPAGLRMVAHLLERLDDDALRVYAYEHGVRTEDELEGEPERAGDAA